MSEYIECMVDINDQECLIQALLDLGVTNEAIEVHEEPVRLYGYMGDERGQKAHIVIRRKDIGTASNDIGFERLVDGKWRIHVSDFDLRQSIGIRIAQPDIGGKGEFMQAYARRRLEKQLKKKRKYRTKSVETREDGTVKMVIQVQA
jgi:hypothetical protein